MKGKWLWLAIGGGVVAGLAAGYLVAVLYLFAGDRLDAEAAQVASAVAVAFFTAVLAVVTTIYALTTATQARAAIAANVLAQAEAIPMLAMAKEYWVEPTPDRPGSIEVSIGLVNIGGGIASQVEIATDWGTFKYKEAAIPSSVRPPANITIIQGGPFTGIERGPAEVPAPPTPTEFWFTDQHGTRYHQAVGGLPEALA